MDAYRKEQLQDQRDAAYLAQPDPERIFLAPKCEGLADEGRFWSEERHDCDDAGCGLKAIEYVRLDVAIAGGYNPMNYR